MPTILTHAVVGVGLARVFTARSMPPLYWGLAAGLAMLPDLDVIAFPLGIPYGARFGHRGFSHSLPCALAVGLLAALLTYKYLAMSWWLLGLFCFAIMASHGLLDAFTNGGLGIALFAPFDATRYFFPWRPVQVSPIGMAFFGPWGLRVLRSEILWIWLPLGVIVAAVLLIRAATGPGRPGLSIRVRNSTAPCAYPEGVGYHSPGSAQRRPGKRSFSGHLPRRGCISGLTNADPTPSG